MTTLQLSGGGAPSEDVPSTRRPSAAEASSTAAAVDASPRNTRPRAILMASGGHHRSVRHGMGQAAGRWPRGGWGVEGVATESELVAVLATSSPCGRAGRIGRSLWDPRSASGCSAPLRGRDGCLLNGQRRAMPLAVCAHFVGPGAATKVERNDADWDFLPAPPPPPSPCDGVLGGRQLRATPPPRLMGVTPPNGAPGTGSLGWRLRPQPHGVQRRVFSSSSL